MFQLTSEEESQRDDAELLAARSSVEILQYPFQADHAGTHLYVKVWREQHSKYPPVVLVHELGEQIQLYGGVVSGLVGAGMTVYGFDLRGHGQSGNLLGHVERFHDLVVDTLQVVSWANHKEPNAPAVVIGFGVGALVAMYCATRYPGKVRALVLCDPCLKLKHEPRGLRRMLIRTWAEFLPRVRLPIALAPRLTDRSTVGRSTTARIISTITAAHVPRISAHFTEELLRALEDAPRVFTQIACETLLLSSREGSVHDYRSLTAWAKAGAARDRILFKQTESHDEDLRVICEWLEPYRAAAREKTP